MRTRFFVAFVAFVSTVALCSCELIIDDLETRPCDPDPPASCADLGDADQQAVGCCNGDATTVWYCSGGTLVSEQCGDLTCDFDDSLEVMGCVE